jgi:hypothetical protein
VEISFSTSTISAPAAPRQALRNNGWRRRPGGGTLPNGESRALRTSVVDLPFFPRIAAA